LDENWSAFEEQAVFITKNGIAFDAELVAELVYVVQPQLVKQCPGLGETFCAFLEDVTANLFSVISYN
ncbi:hypothetical protein VOLCADRAFT_108183, partial [Volvox carteri f. nagariensis]